MINLVVLAGRLTADPKSKDITTKNGPSKVVNFGLAVRVFGKEEKTVYANVSVFGKAGDFVTNYLKKGSPCTVQGRINEVRGYLDKEQQPRASLDVTAESVDAPNTGNAPSGGSGTDTAGNPVSNAVSDDEIPF